MAGIHTSNITSAANNGDVTIDPHGTGKTKVKSHDSTNPGQTPLATLTDGTVVRLDPASLAELTENDLSDDDWIMVQDISDGGAVKKIKKSKVKNFRSAGADQGPFPDPLPGNGTWIDQDSVLGVKAGGNGSTASLKNSVEFAVVNNTYNQNDKSVTIGDDVKIRWIESKKNSATHGQIISGTLYAKSGSSFEQTWNLTIVKQPTAGWDLADVSGQPTSTAITSSLTTPTGMNASSPVTIDGGTLTSIQVSVNGGVFTANPGTIQSGQTIAVRGTTGAASSTGYTALVSIGGLQRTWTVTTAAPVPAVKQPSITSPPHNAQHLDKDITVTSSSYQALNGAAGHLNSDWQLMKDGAVIASTSADATNKTSWTLPESALAEHTTYTVRVKHRSTNPIDSAWSPESTFRTGDFAPDYLPGDPIGGGYFGGQINDGGVIYNLIVAPITGSGYLQGVYGGWSATRIKWKNSRTGPDTGAQGLVWGAPALVAYGNNSEYPALYWCAKQLSGPNAGSYDTTNSLRTGIGGFNDWYLPSKYEFDVIYFHLKPNDYENDVDGGNNPHSVSPYEPNTHYGPDYPEVTTSDIFKEGGGQDFDLTRPWWTASEVDGRPTYVWRQNMLNGRNYDPFIKDNEWFIRAVRRVEA